MARPSTAPTSLLTRAGKLPSVPPTVAQTPGLKSALLTFRAMEHFNDISCFDGPAGSGKTTACAVAARQSSREWRYCILPLNGHPRQIIAAVYEAVFKSAARGTERQMQSALIERLCDGDIGIIADEVHHVGLQGAQQLRYLWDHAQTFGSPFPLLLVGCGVRQELSRANEVLGRVARWVNFHEIDDIEDATLVAAALHPRLAATSEQIIAGMNKRVARRSLRAWTQIAKHIDFLPSTDPEAKKPKPLTRDDVRLLREMRGTDEAAA